MALSKLRDYEGLVKGDRKWNPPNVAVHASLGTILIQLILQGTLCRAKGLEITFSLSTSLPLSDDFDQTLVSISFPPFISGIVAVI